MLYLVSWYWNWVDYQIGFHTHHMTNAQEKLQMFIHLLATHQTNSTLTTYLDVEVLARLVMVEASKAYLTKEVDQDNKEGLFQEYKSLCHKMAETVLDIQPAYPYPHALVSTLIESARKHRFFAQHLPSLTEVKDQGQNQSSLEAFLRHIAFSSLGLGDFSSQKPS